MKKTLITLLLALAMPVMAQTAPTATSIPSSLTSSDLSVQIGTALNNATTNIVYIQQSGNSPIVNITQDGSANRIGADAAGSTNPMVLNGNNQTVSIEQRGIGNVINTLGLATTAGASSVSISQIGDGNSLSADIQGNNANINWQFNSSGASSGNTLTFTGNGNNLTSGINVGGGGNSITSTMQGDGHSQLLTVSGDNNVFNVGQTSSVASTLVVNQNGTGTTFNISQDGNRAGAVNVQAAANGGSFNITQHGR
jgi:hypothetical protein